jgi:phenylalanyl-tRNA synthetase beta chain
MLLSRNWLQEFVDLKGLSSEKIATLLTLKTVEVEGVQDVDGSLENIVVGEIVSIKKHPDADKLHVCHVQTQNSKLKTQNSVQVVCGGTNIRVGIKVAMGMIGAKIRWHGEGELVELKKVKIRGVESFGMICASDEIGLGAMFPKKDEREILDLSHLKAGLGTPVAKAIQSGDVVFEVENKSLSNRPDLWGHYGIARELGAIFGHPLKKYKAEKIKSGKNEKLVVKVEDKLLCPRYMAVALNGIRVEASPGWMQQRLNAVGLRPINNIVDITNYVMMELGQPMHAFDSEHVIDNYIVVRRARDKEKFVTLDNQERKLDKSMLVIADKKKTLAVAGVMGGKNSDITSKTNAIIFEAANFEPTNVRKTACKLGMRTDSSARFEKSLDPNMAEQALMRAVELVLKLCPDANVSSSVIEKSCYKLDQGPIEMSYTYINNKIGTDIPKKEVVKILESLGFGVKQKHTGVSVTIPTWRATKDISIKEDLIEEIVRIYGYENVVGVMPCFSIIPPKENVLRRVERKIKELLAYEFGYTEIYNYSFVAPDWLNRMGESTDKHLALDNPIAKDRPLIRRHLVPNLLVNTEENLHRFDTVSIFEVGKTYIIEEKGEFSGNGYKHLPKQDSLLGMIYSAKGEKIPFFHASNALIGTLDHLGLHAEVRKSTDHTNLIHPGRFAEVYVGGVLVGRIGELHPQKQEKLGIPHRVAMVELNINDLISLLHDESVYTPITVYPSVERDVAFVVEKNIEHASIVTILKKTDKLIENIELFDVYVGKKLGEDKKSMAYHLSYRSAEKTLESAEVNSVHKKVISVLKNKFGAEIRD